MVHWLRLHAPNAGDSGSIPGQGTRARMMQLKIPHAATKISRTATKTQHGQKKKKKKYIYIYIYLLSDSFCCCCCYLLFPFFFNIFIGV